MTAKPSLAQIGELPQTYQATIPADYLDEMGHMNVMWYTHLFGLGIRGLLATVGLDRSYLDRCQAGTFALEKHVRYLAEVRFGQAVSVYTRVVEREGARFHLMQYLVNDTLERLASTMETVSTHVDLTARRSAPMPAEIAAAFDGVAAEHQCLEWEPNLCGVMGLRR